MEIIYKFDFAVLFALQKIHCTLLNVFFAFFTYIGSGGILWIAAAVVLLCIRNKRTAGLAASIALILELVVNEWIIKHIFERPRPFTLHPEIDTIVAKPSSFSFPSGHTCSSFAAATAIFMFDRRLGSIAYVIAAIIGFSRNYFFIHYPTDVICGALEGVLLGLLAAVIVKRVILACKKRRQAEKS